MRAVLALTLLLTACAGEAPENEAVPAPPVATPSLPPERIAPPEDLAAGGVATELLPIPEIEGIAIAPGRWVERETEAGLAALYGRERALFSLRCDTASGDIVIARRGESGSSLTLLTDRGTNLFSAVGGQGGTTARFRATFPWFADTLAKAAGRIGVRVEQGVPLVVPADPAIGRVVAECTRWASRG